MHLLASEIEWCLLKDLDPTVFNEAVSLCDSARSNREVQFGSDSEMVLEVANTKIFASIMWSIPESHGDDKPDFSGSASLINDAISDFDGVIEVTTKKQISR